MQRVRNPGEANHQSRGIAAENGNRISRKSDNEIDFRKEYSRMPTNDITNFNSLLLGRLLSRYIK